VKSRATAVVATLPELLAKVASTLIFISPDGGGIHGWSCNTPVLHMHLAPANHEHMHCHAFISIAWNLYETQLWNIDVAIVCLKRTMPWLCLLG
jgi:hypothetical protein